VTAGRQPQPAWLRELYVAAAAMETEPHTRPPATGGRASAVLILFGAGPDGPDLLFIQRSDDLRLHAGQPAFPGGTIDATDSGPVAAALREAAEEVGVDPDGVEIVGTLPEMFIPRTGFRVVPVLAWWREPGPVAPVDPAEVAAVERIGVSELADPAARAVVRVPDGRTTPAFRVRGMLIWGFTALLVDRLLALAGWERPWAPAEVIDWAPPPGGPGSAENAIRLGSCTEMCSTSS
jgi:8-oxo-dGTP pyrophosphatase MutT (NUDIX family)